MGFDKQSPYSPSPIPVAFAAICTFQKAQGRGSAASSISLKDLSVGTCDTVYAAQLFVYWNVYIANSKSGALSSFLIRRQDL